MKHLLFLFTLFSFIFSTTLLVPEEYSTIQAGVDAAVDGDTVLVNQGIYYENIHLTKSIVLTSYAIFDDLNIVIAKQREDFDNMIFRVMNKSNYKVDKFGIPTTIYSFNSLVNKHIDKKELMKFVWAKIDNDNDPILKGIPREEKAKKIGEMMQHLPLIIQLTRDKIGEEMHMCQQNSRIILSQNSF